jgi:hypothetical protein
VRYTELAPDRFKDLLALAQSKRPSQLNDWAFD